MLKFNPKRIFKLRGIERMSGFLVKSGFTYAQATKFLRAGKPTLKISQIERLCIALNCTPNDLFEWKAGGDTVLPDGHSLNVLNRGEKTRNLQEMVKNIPSDKFTLIENLLSGLEE